MATVVDLGQALRQRQPQQPVNPKSAIGQLLLRKGSQMNANQRGAGIRSAGESILGALLLSKGFQDQQALELSKREALAKAIQGAFPGKTIQTSPEQTIPGKPMAPPETDFFSTAGGRLTGDVAPDPVPEPSDPNMRDLDAVATANVTNRFRQPESFSTGPALSPPPDILGPSTTIPAQTRVEPNKMGQMLLNLSKQGLIDSSTVVGAFQNQQLQKREDQIRKEDRDFKKDIISDEHQFTFKRDELKFGRDVALTMLATKPTNKGTLWEHLTTAGYKEGTPKWNEAARKWLSKKSGTNVTLNTAQKAVEQLGKKMADLTIDQQDKAEKAVKSINNIIEAREVLNKGIRSGVGANFMTTLNSFLVSRMGFDAGRDVTENTQSFAAIIARQTLNILGSGDLGAGTGLSDNDLRFAEKAAAASIEIDEKAIRRIMKINEDVFRDALGKFNKRAASVNKWVEKQGSSLPFSLGVEIPPKVESAQSKPKSNPAVIPQGQLPPSSGTKPSGPKHLIFDSKGNRIQ